MRKNRVFVVQNQHRWNRDAGRFEPKFDLTPAQQFGELVYLLSPTAAPFRPEPVIEELREKLADFGPDDGFFDELRARAHEGDDFFHGILL